MAETTSVRVTNVTIFASDTWTDHTELVVVPTKADSAKGDGWVVATRRLGDLQGS